MKNRPDILAITAHYPAKGSEEAIATETLIREVARRAPVRFVWAATENAQLPSLQGQETLPLPAHTWIADLFGNNSPKWKAQAWPLLHEAMGKADAVWIHGVLEGPLNKARALALRLKKPLILTYTGKLPRTFLDRSADKRKVIPALRSANHTIFTNDAVGEDYFARAGFTRPISIIPPGIDLRTFHAPLLETRRYLRQQFALRPDQPILLFSGPLEKESGLDVIRLMAKKLPNWRFWIAGQGSIEPEKWLLPNLHVFNDKQGAALAELYHTADILLAPFHGKGFPRQIQEAMACGLPVLTSPAIAEGCRPATPWLNLAHVWPEAPRRTAEVWARKVLDFPVPLPLQNPLYALADFAQMTWEWAPIANAYAEIFSAYETVPPAP